MNSLDKLPNPGAVADRLKNLPKSPYATYDEAMERINSQVNGENEDAGDALIAKKVLFFRSLSKHELDLWRNFQMKTHIWPCNSFLLVF